MTDVEFMMRLRSAPVGDSSASAEYWTEAGAPRMNSHTVHIHTVRTRQGSGDGVEHFCGTLRNNVRHVEV